MTHLKCAIEPDGGQSIPQKRNKQTNLSRSKMPQDKKKNISFHVVKYMSGVLAVVLSPRGRLFIVS